MKNPNPKTDRHWSPKVNGDYKRLIKQLKRAMTRSGIDHTQLAKELGVTQGTARNWLSGKVSPSRHRDHIQMFIDKNPPDMTGAEPAPSLRRSRPRLSPLEQTRAAMHRDHEFAGGLPVNMDLPPRNGELLIETRLILGDMPNTALQTLQVALSREITRRLEAR